MLERIHIENYKCLRDVTVDLADFTILIGPNDSGKSSFLEVIQTFGMLVTQGYPGTFKGDRSLANLVWGRDPGLHIGLEVEGTTLNHRFVYGLELPVDERPPCETLEWDGAKVLWTEEPRSGQRQPQQQALPDGTPVVVVPQGEGGQPSRIQLQRGMTGLQVLLQQRQSPYLSIADVLKSSVEYHFEPDKLSKAAIPRLGIELDPSGENLAAVLDVMQNSPDRSSFVAIQDALHDAIPTVRGIVLPPATRPSRGQGPGVCSFAKRPYTCNNSGVPGLRWSPASNRVPGAGLFSNTRSVAYRRARERFAPIAPEDGSRPLTKDQPRRDRKSQAPDRCHHA